MAVVILLLRMRRPGRAARLRLETLWVMPAIFIGLAVYVLTRLPPAADQWIWLALAAVLGGAVGWYRGRMMRIAVDPQTHALNQQVSPAALVFLLALIAVRTGLRYLASAEGRDWGIDPIFVTDMFLVFAVGMIAITRLEMGLRARRLLAIARAARG